MCSRWLWRLLLEQRLSVPLAGRTNSSAERHFAAGAPSRGRIPAALTQRCPEASPTAASKMLFQNISLPSGFLDIWVLDAQGCLGQSRGCRSGGRGWAPNPIASAPSWGALPPRRPGHVPDPCGARLPICMCCPHPSEEWVLQQAWVVLGSRCIG